MQDTRAEPRYIPLWAGREHPRMIVWALSSFACPPMHRIAAMLVFRGGAYRTNNGSGAGCAEFFSSRGILGVEVEYRTKEGPGECAVRDEEGPLFPRPVQDGARAVRIVRHMAAGLGVDPNRIGVSGFSAGGHLAALLCGSELPCQEAEEEDLAHISHRPDVCILSYPVISMLPSLRGPGNLSNSAENLGCSTTAGVDESLSLSAEYRIHRGHPPTFLWHTRADQVVPVAHSEVYAEALKEKGVDHTRGLLVHSPLQRQ